MNEKIWSTVDFITICHPYTFFKDRFSNRIKIIHPSPIPPLKKKKNFLGFPVWFQGYKEKPQNAKELIILIIHSFHRLCPPVSLKKKSNIFQAL